MGPLTDQERHDLFHAPEPVAATVQRLAGTPASLLDLHAYPVLAECRECGRKIRSDNYLLSPWVHVPEGS